MDKNRIKKSLRLTVFILFLSMLLLFTSSCVITGGDEEELIEHLLQKVDAMDGEMTIVTKEGETVTITITKETSTESKTQDNRKDEQKNGQVDKGSPSSMNLMTILPSLECIEDVFKVLGSWEDAHEWREKGLTWSHIAEELGYNADKMYAELIEIAERNLQEAKEAGLINQELLEQKLAYFSEIAMKWVKEIFADTDKDPIDPASIVPTMECIEDVFKVLGSWEDAHEWREKGLTWSHIAEELGYNADKMYAELIEIAERNLQEAKEAGLINQELLEQKLAYFSEIAMKWVKEIFAE